MPPVMAWWESWKMRRRRERKSRECDALGVSTRIDATIEKRQPGGRLEIGEDGWIQGRLILEQSSSRIRIGNRVAIGGATILDCAGEIVLEDDVMVSYDCILADSDNHSLLFSERRQDVLNWKRGFHDWSKAAIRPIHIARGAWIGARVCILKGVKIGEGAVVGMGSVVTRPVAAWTVVAGNPARQIRSLDPGKAAG